MITKKCKKCQAELPVDTGFYDNDNTCKECRKSRVRQNRKDKIDYYKEYDRKRANRSDRVEARKRYAKTPEGIEAGNRSKIAWIRRNQKKKWAANCVCNAVRDGKIVKPTECEACGNPAIRIEGHHDDYDRPLDVKWLCSKCHREWHKLNGEGANAN
jgi:transposase-like protein